MAKLDRQTQLIFASSAGSRELTAFGTAKNNVPEFTNDIEQIQNINYLEGWSSAVLADKAPYEEDTNALLFMITRQLAYLYQSGIPEYDADTAYFRGNICAANDGSGLWYKSLTDNNTGNPLTDTVNWQLIELSKRTLPLFTQITLDYVLQNDDAVGWALQGSLVNGNVYPDAFNKILNLYNSGTEASYRGISAVLSSDGRYITPVNNKNAVDNLFNNTGIADIYVIDTSSSSFYLPKTSRFIQYTTDAGALNKYNAAGLPAPNIRISGAGSVTTSLSGNHNHSAGSYTASISGTLRSAYGGLQGTGDFENTGSGPYSQTASGSYGNRVRINISKALEGVSGTGGQHSHTVDLGNFTASASGGLYGANSTVQPASSNKFLYYLVGDTAN